MNNKKAKGIYKDFLSYLTLFDRNPIYFQFGLGKRGRFGTGLGGCWFILFIIIALIFLIKSCLNFFNWSKYNVTYFEKSIQSNAMNFKEMNFNFAMQIYFKNNTSIKNTKFENLFIFDTNLIKINKDLKRKIPLNLRPCNIDDFKVNNIDQFLKKVPFENLKCINNITNLEIKGSNDDEDIYYIQNEIKINNNFFDGGPTNENYKSLKNIFKENTFKLKIAYIDLFYDVTSLEQPIIQKMDSITNYLNFNSLKKVKINFQQFTYMEDKNMFSHNHITKNFFKQVNTQENYIEIPNRFENIDKQNSDSLVQIRLISNNNIKILKKDFLTMPEFLLLISNNLISILIWSSLFIGMYNLIQAKQYVMSKIMKYADSLNERSMNNIAIIKNTFNEFEVKNKFKKLFNIKSLNLFDIGKKKKRIRRPKQKWISIKYIS